MTINYPSGAIPFKFSNATLHFETRAHYFETVFAFSHPQQTWFCASTQTSSLSARKAIEKAKNAIKISQKREKKLKDINFNPVRVQPTAGLEYVRAVKRALSYIQSGDIYQVNVAHSFESVWNGRAADLYLRMRKESPAFYGAFIGSRLTASGGAICSISPELFLHTRSGIVVTRPIKGTRPRGATVSEHDCVRRELIGSAKERAELNMIVDLERNDLGRVCIHGSVKVDSSGEVEELPTLLHRTATVSGRLRPRTMVGELLAATFPGGSITGAPKLRAMEIIAELESTPRGPYCGAIGWVGARGDLELNIAIRTAICDEAKGTARYFAGSGIVADSEPEKEYEETLLKAAAFFSAVNSR